VETAFLHAPLKEEVYITLPHDHPERMRSDGKPRIFRLKKALYGLKQGPHDWNVEFNETLVKKCGFTRLQSDPCAYVKRSRTGKLITMVVFVDDTVMSYNKQDQAEADEIMSIIKSAYSVVDLGEAKHILGMRITRDREAKTLTLDHERFILDLLEKTGMKNCVPVSTPEAPGIYLTSAGALSAKHPRVQVAVTAPEGDWKPKVSSMVGALLYTAGWLRPDIQHAVIQVARFVSNPQPAHWEACKRILRYLRGTPSLGLTFGRQSKGVQQNQPVAFADASWGDDPEDRRSTTGVIIKMNGGAIIWTSRKQKCVATSSAEAEYMALGDATKEIMWLRQLLSEMQHAIQGATPLFGDNNSALATAKHDAHHSRMKHIDIKHHFIREHVREGNIALIWVSTQLQQADILTKGLGKIIFNDLRAKVMNGESGGSVSLLVRALSCRREVTMSSQTATTMTSNRGARDCSTGGQLLSVSCLAFPRHFTAFSTPTSSGPGRELPKEPMHLAGGQATDPCRRENTRRRLVVKHASHGAASRNESSSSLPPKRAWRPWECASAAGGAAEGATAATAAPLWCHHTQNKGEQRQQHARAVSIAVTITNHHHHIAAASYGWGAVPRAEKRPRPPAGARID